VRIPILELPMDLRRRVRPRRETAFTLVELLVVIVVLAVLLAVAAPSFLGHRDKAYDSKAKQHLVLAWKAAKFTTVEHSGSLPPLSSLLAEMSFSEPTLVFSQAADGTALSDPDTTVVIDSDDTTSGHFVAYVRSGSGTVFCLVSAASGQHEIYSADDCDSQGPVSGDPDLLPQFDLDDPPAFVGNPSQARVGSDLIASAGTITGANEVRIVPCQRDEALTYNLIAWTYNSPDWGYIEHWIQVNCTVYDLYTSYTRPHPSDVGRYLHFCVAAANFHGISFRCTNGIPIVPDLIVFAGYNDANGGNTDLWRANPDGSNTESFGTPGPEDCPTISPDGSEIVYIENGYGGPGDLYRRNADGSGRTSLGISDASNPVFSADGTWIAYLYQDPNDLSIDIRVANRDGSGVATVVADWEGAWGNRPLAWAPDGLNLIVVDQETYPHKVVRIAVASGARTTLYSAAPTDHIASLSVSPSSGRIAIVGAFGGQAQVRILSSGGSLLDTIDLSSELSSPYGSIIDYSPNGEKLIFQDDWDEELWTMDEDGSNLTNLTLSGEWDGGINHYAPHCPSW
jgi:type IV pilus assembly protein PilA